MKGMKEKRQSKESEDKICKIVYDTESLHCTS